MGKAGFFHKHPFLMKMLDFTMLFYGSDQNERNFPQTFPHPVENLFPHSASFVAAGCVPPVKQRHFNDKSTTFYDIFSVI